MFLRKVTKYAMYFCMSMLISAFKKVWEDTTKPATVMSGDGYENCI